MNCIHSYWLHLLLTLTTDRISSKVVFNLLDLLERQQ